MNLFIFIMYQSWQEYLHLFVCLFLFFNIIVSGVGYCPDGAEALLELKLDGLGLRRLPASLLHNLKMETGQEVGLSYASVGTISLGHRLRLLSLRNNRLSSLPRGLLPGVCSKDCRPNCATLQNSSTCATLKCSISMETTSSKFIAPKVGHRS